MDNEFNSGAHQQGNFENCSFHGVTPPGETAGGGSAARPTDITTKEKGKEKLGFTVEGHPDGYFVNISRIHWAGGFRSTDAYQIEPDGVLLQNSWMEDGNIDHYGVYIPGAVIELREYTDDEGERRVGRVIAKREPRPWWRRIFGGRR